MRGPGPWGPPMWGFWWIFPLMGLLFCLAFLTIAVRFMASGRGFMPMGGHQERAADETTALRREIAALREEIEMLKSVRRG